MSVAKVVEVICEGPTIEEAINTGISEVAKTIKHIKHVDIEHIHAHVKDNKVNTFRVIIKVSFAVES